MTDLTFDFEWLDPQEARGPELRATWARWGLGVAGESVTKVHDTQARSVRESLYLPLYPLGEWIASNWWRLLYEVQSPEESSDEAYRSRHSLSAAGEGFALPDLLFKPQGGALQLSWKPREPEWMPLEFLSSGLALVDREVVSEALAGFVEAILARLEEHGISETPLAREWRALTSLDVEERKFCEYAAILGWDPFAVSDDQVESLLEVGRQLPEEILPEFLSAVSSGSLRMEAKALKDSLHLLADNPTFESLRDLSQSFRAPMGTGRPWELGYATARALRAELGIGDGPLSSWERMEAVLGLPAGTLPGALHQAPSLTLLDGVVAFDEKKRPGFALRPTREPSQRFVFSRQLFESLTTDEQVPRLVTRADTIRQQANRAFAAELLAPSDALRSRIHKRRVTNDELEDLSTEYGVSSLVIEHQVENHQIAKLVA